MALLAVSCSKNDDPGPGNDKDPGNNAIANTLHIAFKTPDWQRHIDCSHLDMPPVSAGEMH